MIFCELLRARNPLAFLHEDHLIYFHIFQRIDLPARPVHSSTSTFSAFPSPK